MNKQLLQLSFIVGSLMMIANTQAQNWSWISHAGGTYADYVYQIKKNPAGNLVTCGVITNGTASFGTFSLNTTGVQRGWVACQDTTNGTYLWLANTTGSGSAGIFSMDLDAAGNVYVTGYIAGIVNFGTADTLTSGATRTLFVAKLNSSGVWQWAYKLSGAANALALNTGDAILVSPDGASFYVGGRSHHASQYSTYLTSANGTNSGFTIDYRDGYIAKFDSSGNYQWGVLLNSTGTVNGETACNVLRFDNTGNIVASGYWTGSITNLQVSGPLDAASTISYISGNNGSEDFLMKIAATGDILWKKNSFNNTALTAYAGGSNKVHSIAIDPTDNSIHLVGEANTGFGIYFKYNENADSLRFVNTTTDKAIFTSVILNSTQSPLMAGKMFGAVTVSGVGSYNTAGGNDYCIARADKATGMLNYFNRGGGVGGDIAYDLCANGNKLYTAGIFGGLNILFNGLGTTANYSSSSPVADLITVAIALPEPCVAPFISQEPTSKSVCVGGSVTFNLVSSGATPLTYQWRYNGTNIQNSNSNSYTISNAVSGNAGSYSCIVTNSCRADTSVTVTLTVNNPPNAAITPANATICNGQSQTLTASGGTTYVWSNGGGSNAAATFSPSSTTTYTVTVTAANTCTATASRSVTVNQNPTATITPASATICNGASQTLTASGGGTYAWSHSGGGNATATFSPATSTTYTVTVTNASNCTATASRLVTVNQNPTAAISPASASICNGSSQQLTASGGGTYVWSNSLGSNATQTVSPNATTTYTVTVTNANNCSAAASSTVTVNTVTASINGPTTICSGLNATLTASGGGTYAWSNSGGTNAQATFTPTSATTYTVTVTGSGNCTATASQTVSVQSSPTATITGANTVCAGSSITLTANGGNTYTWANGLGSNAAITVTPTQATTYTVTVSIGANCSATASHTVSLLQPSTGAISATICSGSSYSFNNQQLTQTGSYSDTLVNNVGCDSILTLTLTVSAPLQGSFAETICNGSSFSFNNQSLTQSGAYADTVQTQAGCDSIVTLNLTVLGPINTVLNESICANDSFAFNGQQLTQAGQYFDTLVAVSGCDSLITLNLSIDAVPQITTQPTASSSTVCAGETVTLSVIAAGGNLSYQWKENNNNEGPNAATYTTGILTAGTKSYTVDVSNGCGSETSNAVSVTVNALPSPTITQSGNTLSTQSFSSYQWQLNGSDITNANAQTYTATANGNYTVEVTDANGCNAISAIANVTGVGIAELTQFNTTIYPNPASTQLYIAAEEAIAKVRIVDLLGREWMTLPANGTMMYQLDISQLAEAAYFVQISSTGGKQVQRIFIKH